MGFVSSVMFNLHPYLLVVRACIATKSKVFECRKLINHKDLSIFSVGKFCVTVTAIDCHHMIVATRYPEAMHVDRLDTEQMKLSLLGMAKDTLLCLCKLLEPR